MTPVYEYRYTRHRIAETPPALRGPERAAALIAALIAEEERECLVVVALNAKNEPLAAEIVYRGNVSSSLVRVGELFRLPLRMTAAAVIIGHNHPSGDPTPSPDDLALTAEAVAAGKLLDCPVLDHVITGDPGRYVSLRDRGVSFG